MSAYSLSSDIMFMSMLMSRVALRKYLYYRGLILLLLMSIFSELASGALSPYQYLNLSNDALASSLYYKTIEVSEKFLLENINSNYCTSESLCSHLSNLKNAFDAIGKPQQYRDFSWQLFQMIDPKRVGTLIRCFFIFALDAKGNYFENSNLCNSFSLFGDNKDGLLFFDSYRKKLPEDFIASKPLLQAWLHVVRADLLAYNQEFENAESEIDLSENIIRQNFPKGASEYLIPDLAKELLYAMQGNWDKAISKALENQKQLEKLGTATRESYALEARLQYYYMQIGDLQKSLESGKKAVIKPSRLIMLPFAIDYRAIQGPLLFNSPSYIMSEADQNKVFERLANAAFTSGHYDDGIFYATRLLYNLEKEIADNYSRFAFNRADPSLKQKVDLLVNVSPSMALQAPNDSLLQALAFDAALIYKQLSLSAGNLYRNLIPKIGNPAISAHYVNLENSRKLLETVPQEKADSLLNRISHLEAILQKHIANRTNVSLSSLPKWQDVRSALMPGEIAVEFFIASKNDENRYVATLLSYDCPYPQFFDLCKVEDIDQIHDILNGKTAFDFLFKPFEECMMGAKTLYFSPTGSLSLLPLEYILTDDEIRLNERIEMVRLSSTRELAFKKGIFNPENIILYGGVKYNLDEDEMDSKSHLSRGFADNSYSCEIEPDLAFNLRAGLSYLPGSLIEVTKIAGLLASSGFNAELIQGTGATETSIKRLDNKQVQILHIATHGFNVQNGSRNRLSRMLAEKNYRSTFEEQSLGLSGLMMAGASNTLAGNKLDDSDDDGLLTGREISRINLSNVELAVLSACESGRGEIGAEGVMGLQRAFKKAGVQTLVMSLWKVDDTATSILMSEFYNNLIHGLNPTQSLKSAQKYLRQADNGAFDNPIYWGAFIILDAI